MRTLLRWSLRLLANLFALAVALPATLAVLLGWSLPERGTALVADIAALRAPVDVAIDADGVPRIRANSAEDGAAALGWLHARDRMFQMELMRRAAAGELSELVGSTTLSLDRMMRVLGIRQSAQADLATLDASTRAMLEAYAAGVNAFIAARGRFAAAEFVLLGAPRPWEPLDSLLWAKTMGLWLSGNWRTELARARLAGLVASEILDAVWPPSRTTLPPHATLDPGLAETAGRLADALPRFPAPFTLPASASNAWAVDARHSTTGAPLLAGDPHLGFSLPGTWYLARIETPDGVLAGATAPGVPMIVLGHNGRIAWSFTTTGADVQDLFVETALGSDRYLAPGGPVAFTVREETIRVRWQKNEVLHVRETRHGPVVSDLVAPDGPVLALSMGNLARPDTAAMGLLALNRAGDVAAAGRAATLITAPVQNLLVADRRTIALFVTGRVPIRRAGDGSTPAPGADGSHDWIGFASADALPRVVAPASGRLVNANDRVVGPDFPVFLGRDWHDDLRARRARELLAARAQHSVESFAAMQTDTLSLFARDVLPRLRTLAMPLGTAQQAQSLLTSWDGTMHADAPQPLIFNAWMRRFARLWLAGLGAGEDTAAPWWHLAAHALSPAGAAWCARASADVGCDGLLARALHEAVPPLVATHGADPAAWRWGAAHHAVFAHPLLRLIPPLRKLATIEAEIGGDGTTLLRAAIGGSGFDAVHGAGFRAVYDLADLERSRFVAVPGQSGHVPEAGALGFVARWQQGATVTLAAQPETTGQTLRLLPAPALGQFRLEPR